MTIEHFTRLWNVQYILELKTTNSAIGRRNDNMVLICWYNWTLPEHSSEFKTTDFLRKIAFPQRDRVLRFSTHHISERGFKGEE